MASETGIPGEMKGCKELVQEGMQVRKLELEGTLGETVVGVPKVYTYPIIMRMNMEGTIERYYDRRAFIRHRTLYN